MSKAFLYWADVVPQQTFFIATWWLWDNASESPSTHKGILLSSAGWGHNRQRWDCDRSVGWTPDHESRQAIAQQSWFFSYIVWRIGMFSPSSAHTGTLYKYSRWVPHTAKYPKMPRKFSTSKERGTSWSGQQKDLSLAAHTAACSLFLALSPTVLSADQLWWLGKTRRWKVNSGEVVVLPPKFAG